MVELVALRGAGFNVTDVPSLDRRNTERHPDGPLVSMDYNLAWAIPDQNHLAPEGCGDLRFYLTRLCHKSRDRGLLRKCSC